MTDSGSARPRRALPPLPDDDVDAPPIIGRRGLRALAPDAGREPVDLETQVLRRVMPSESPASPATLSRVWTPSPVPPPRPVLPGSSTLPASAGRRFSSDSPTDHSYTPRRSATSVASPPEDYFVPASRTAEPTRTAADPTPSTPLRAEPAGDEPAPPRRRSGKRALIVLGGVAAITGLVIGGSTWLAPKSPASLVPPVTTASPSLDPLLGANDLAPLGPTTSWVTVAAAPGGGDGNPVCLPAAAETMPVADRTDRRVLTSESAAVGYVSHVVDSYPDRASAQQAYQQRLLQAGSCADTDVLIVASDTVAGLADNAFVTQIQLQGLTTENHTVLVSQTGRNLSMIDVSAPDRVLPEDVAKVAAKPLSRLCSGGQGTCPSTPELAASVPAAGQNPGWLIEADLPRITPGAGRWAASRPDSKLTIVGSQCEAVTLKQVEGVTASAQRTLLLADDPDAPTVFGVDQVVYTFPDAKAAKSLADKLSDNIGECSDTVPTASVDKGPSIKGEGAEAVAFSGTSFRVTQQTSTTNSVSYRVGVIRVGERVTYLLANPSADFDFTDAQWKAILQRAGQRVSQMP